MRTEDRRPVAVVTGAAGGIGSTLVSRLVDDGHDVLAVVPLPHEPPVPPPPAARCELLMADLTDPAGRGRAADAVRSEFGSLDCLVNIDGLDMRSLRNDCYRRPIASAEIDGAVLDRSLAINAVAPIALVLLPLFRNGAGRILNRGTSRTAMLRAGFLSYAMSKAALEAGSAVLARDLQGSGVTVHVLHPAGPVNTPMACGAEPELHAQLQPACSLVVAPARSLASPAGASRHGQRRNTRLWRTEAPDAAFALIASLQLEGDSASGADAAISLNPGLVATGVE